MKAFLSIPSFLALSMVWAASTTPTQAVSVPLPAGVGPVPVERLRLDNPAVLSMAGDWRFQITRGADFQDGRFAPTQAFATASSAATGNIAAKGLDPTTSTVWEPHGALPQWWQMDLGSVMQVRALDTRFAAPWDNYQYKVEGSLDGKNWTLLADKTAPPGVSQGPLQLTRTDCRYVRLTFTGAQVAVGPKSILVRNLWLTVVHDGKEMIWHPGLDEEIEPLNAFAQTTFDDGSWSHLPVPGNWEMAGFSRPTYAEPDDAVGLYRRWMTVPAGFAGKQIIWHFDGVFDSAEIFINGLRVGYHESGYTAFDVDVTAALKPGENNLFAVRVCKNDFSVDLDTGDFWSLGGIYRENYLVAVPKLHISGSTITTPLDSRHIDAVLSSQVEVEGSASQRFSLTGRLYTFDGRDAGLPAMRQQGVTGADGKALVTLSEPVQAPKLWSAEKPNLYYLMLELSGGGPPERVEERFGFRQVEIRGGVVLWNGVPVKLTGVCRHEEWSALGHALDEAAWQKDLELIKAANINAVRTSHYNHAQRFLELCDEKGLYVLDEVPGCWCDPSQALYQDAWLQRTRETFQRDRNRPCVLGWSIGNESNIGVDNKAAFALMHQLDSTRPAFISRIDNPKAYANFELADFHYPSPDLLAQIIKSPARLATPFAITEGPHTFYEQAARDYDPGCEDYWGAALLNQWKPLWPTPSSLGAFIWEWQDQGLADKYFDAKSHAALPPASQPSQPVLRDNNFKGIVDGYRDLKPEYWNVKMAYSPVVIDCRDVKVANGAYILPLQNRHAFTNLSDLTCEWQALAGDKVLSAGSAYFDCAPGSSVQERLPVVPGAQTLTLTFLHPDGRTIYATRLATPEAKQEQFPAPIAVSGPVQLDEQNGIITAGAAGSKLLIDRRTGLMTSWQAGNDSLAISGPILNLGEARAYHNDLAAADRKDNPLMVQSRQAPFLKNVTVQTTAPVLPPGGDGSAGINVRGDVYLIESPELVGALAYTMRVQTNGSVNVAWKLTWKAPPQDAFELGLKMMVPSSLNTLSWSRDNLWTVYPPGHIGALLGTVTSDDLSFRCTKRDAHWAVLGGDLPEALAVVRSEGPLQTRTRKEGDQTVVFLSSALGPPQSLSTPLVADDEIHLKPHETQNGAFEMMLTPRRADPSAQARR